MGKSSKKKKKQDFQKVKLKVGKKLKKADNVTNASFKSRSIQISQQLKSGDTSLPTTRKKQNIQELFSHCRHYSASTRHEGVMGLKELVGSHPELVHSHISNILEKCSELLCDKDSVVRQAAIKNLLKSVLPLISEKQISPFFPLVCAHLCCAMTHINDSIKVDSLLVLDLLLEHYPKLMISKSNQVLENFIDQISLQQGQGQTRSLSTNPNSETSSQKWRISVMKRLQKFLKAVLLYCEDESGRDKMEVNEDIMTFNLTEVNRVHLFPAYVKNTWETSGFTYSAGSTGKTEDKCGVFEEKFHQFVTSLVPLLLQCWVEATPSATTAKLIKYGGKGKGNVGDCEDTSMMYCIVKVTQLLWECVTTLYNNQSVEPPPMLKHEKDFQSHFLRDFPYTVNNTPVDRKQKKNKHTPSQEQVSAEMLNLTVCDLMINFLADDPISAAPARHWMNTVLRYMVYILNVDSTEIRVSHNARLVVKMLDRLRKTPMAYEAKGQELFESAFTRYRSANPLSQEKHIYLKFFTRIILQDDTVQFLSETVVKSFLSSLPELLTHCAKDNSQMAPLIISVMKKTSCRSSTKFLNDPSLKQAMFKLYDIESGIILSLKSGNQRDLIGLLYNMSVLETDMVRRLTSLCRCEQLGETEVKYLIQVLHQRYSKFGELPTDAAVHIGFLANLLGCRKADAMNNDSKMETCDSVTETCGIVRMKIVNTLSEASSWDRHVTIVDAVTSVIQQCFNTDQVVELLLTFLENTTNSSTLLTLEAAYSTCKLAESFKVPERVIPFVQELSFSLVNLLVTCEEKTNQNAVSQILDTGCNAIMKTENGMQSLLSKAIEAAQQDVTEKSLSTTLKTVLLFMTEGIKQCFVSNQHCVQLMSQLLEVVTQVSKVEMSKETQKLLATFEYHVSMMK